MNNMRGDVAVNLGGEEYTLRPTFEALVEIESATGMGIIPLAKKFLAHDFSMSHIKVVLVKGITASGGKVPNNLNALIMETGPVVLGGRIAEFLASALSGGETKNGEAPEGQA